MTDIFPSPPVDVPTLMAMGAETFTALVQEAVRPGTPPALWEALTDPSLIGRTRKTLGSLQLDLQAQLSRANAELEETRAECMARGDAGKGDYFAFKNEQAEWRTRTAGFQRMVTRRIAFVKARMPHGPSQQASPIHPGLSRRARKHNRVALENLARAVAEHQGRVTSGNGDESDDETLWACLSKITAMIKSGDELPLTEWLEYLDDTRDDEF